jgi:hypothetical protein
VADEYYARYQHLSHRELYGMLKTGSPDQVDTLASTWKSLHDSADHLSTTLTQDLGRLSPTWDSAAGREYQRRLGLISSYTSTLAQEFSQLHQGLTLLSGLLRTALQKAEDPANTDDMDKTVKDAGIGFLVAGPPGAAVGAWLGHNQDQEEQDKAHQRMIQLVAGLAANYDQSTGSTWPTSPALPPDGLPDDGSGGEAHPNSGPTGGRAGSVGATGSGGDAGHRDVADPNRPGQLPSTGDGSGTGQFTGPDGTPLDDSSGTSLLGASGIVGAGTLTVGGLAASFFGANAGTKMAGAASQLGGAAGARGVVPNGGVDARRELGINQNRAATGNLNRSGAGSGRGTADGDHDPDERLTWLTEDDMVWSDGEPVAPPVLGDTPSTESREVDATADGQN